MNAKQRRKLDRKTPHKISITRKGGETWLEYDDRAIEAVEWCKKKSKGSYVILNRFNDATFKFEKEGDAVMFGLLWI